MSHLAALNIRLTHERARLAEAKTPAEREQRQVWVAQIEREIAGEREFLGLPPEHPVPDLSDDELLAELFEPGAPF